jgi:pimeloyl-ACP methyl ester carboxylesterase
MSAFSRDGITFNYREAGDGLPFVFQHGLGGDVNQPFGLMSPPPDGFRLLAMDFRANGETQPVGDPEKIGIAPFADDLAAFLDHLNIRQAIIGGISLGAAVALNFTLRYPDRVLGLILSRPAWVDEAFPENTRLYPRMAKLIREHGALPAREIFKTWPEYQAVLAESPDAAKSYLGQFENARAEDAVIKLERIPHDRPCRSREEFKAIRVPTLVLGNRQDPIHPYAIAETLAATIPGAQFAELTPKSVSVDAHAADVRRTIGDYLHQHFSTRN